MTQERLPTSLVVVAILYILVGVVAVLDVVSDLSRNRVSLNFGVLGLLIGPGLLRLRPGWRTCALVFTWIVLIGAPLLALVVAQASGPFYLTVFGQRVGRTSKDVGFLMLAAAFLLNLWIYRVLTRPDIRRRFGLVDPAP